MTDNQELMRELAKLGYESHIKDEVVVIVISPADFVRGHKLLKADLERLGWNRSYSYTPSRPLTPEEQAEWERYIDPFPELRNDSQRQRPAAKKQQHPARTGSGTASYRARMAEDLPAKKTARKAAAPADDMQIPGQRDIFQFLGGVG